MVDYSIWILPLVITLSIIISSFFNIKILNNSKKSQINNNRPWIISHTLPKEESSILIDTKNI